MRWRWNTIYFNAGECKNTAGKGTYLKSSFLFWKALDEEVKDIPQSSVRRYIFISESGGIE
jgi:hypothetical protein